MNEKRFSFFNIFLLCIFFGLLFFIKIDSFAVENSKTAYVTGINGSQENDRMWNYFEVSFSYKPSQRTCVYHTGYQTPVVYSIGNDIPSTYSLVVTNLHTNTITQNTTETIQWTSAGITTNSYYFYLPNGMGFSNTSASNIPFFNDFEDVRNYLINGTLPVLPFDDSLKLDKFKVISKGDWIQEVLNGFVRFDHIVCQPFWSDDRISSVELSVYASDPSYNYQPRNFTFDSDQSGQYHDFDISGLTLHGQKFVVRATPYSLTRKGVSIAYEFTFPNEFTQPLGDLVIKEPNTYPYSTTLDISGNDVPIEWTVTQTPIYIYETNNIEQYYYQDPVAYPVPEITQDTPDNYYQEYVENYYNTYTYITNEYNNTFDNNYQGYLV